MHRVLLGNARKDFMIAVVLAFFGVRVGWRGVSVVWRKQEMFGWRRGKGRTKFMSNN